jgi:hypothetical protein
MMMHSRPQTLLTECVEGNLLPMVLFCQFRPTRQFLPVPSFGVNRSLVEGYVTEEVIEFCVDFVDSIDSIGVPVSRHDGRILGKGTIGRKACLSNDTYLFNKAHLVVLQQSTLVTLNIDEHK